MPSVVERIVFVAVLLYICTVVFFQYRYKSSRLIKLRQRNVLQLMYDELDRNNDIHQDTQHNSKHMWNESLSPEIRRLIHPLNEEIIHRLGTGYSYVPAMTELYWASQENNNSDQQFVSTHYDGPFYYCDVQRVLVVISGSPCVHTHFPSDNATHTLQSGDVMVFHYDSTPHYISVDASCDDKTPRILLKLHYVRAPYKAHCARVHCTFGRQSRDLFNRNKRTLASDAVVARLGLHYVTYRPYVLVTFAVAFAGFLYTGHPLLRAILYLFVVTELVLVLYIIQFMFFSHKGCPAQTFVHGGSRTRYKMRP